LFCIVGIFTVEIIRVHVAYFVITLRLVDPLQLTTRCFVVMSIVNGNA